MAQRSMIRRYQWTHRADLTFDSTYDDSPMMILEAMIIDWVRRIQVTEHLQVAFYSMTCMKQGHPHAHVLMAGRGNHNGEIRTLNDVDLDRCASAWPFLATFERIENFEKATHYVAAHVYKFKSDDWSPYFYNRNLLERIQRGT